LNSIKKNHDFILGNVQNPDFFWHYFLAILHWTFLCFQCTFKTRTNVLTRHKNYIAFSWFASITIR